MKTTLFSLAVLVLAGGLALTDSVAQQTTPSRKETDPEAKARVRRVAEGVETTSKRSEAEPAANDSKSQSSATESKSATTDTAVSETSNKQQTPETVAKSDAAKPTAPDAKAPSDPIAALRGEIEAAEIGPERIKLQLKLAEQLVTSGYKTEAVKELHAIAATEVFDPAGFYNLGNALARLGETEAAINAYQKAVDQRQGNYSRAYNNLGVVLLRAGRWDEAHDALLKALKRESFRYAEASYNLGRVYTARGQSDLAVREWRRAIAVDPKHEAAAAALAHTGSEGRIVVETQKRTLDKQPEKQVARNTVAGTKSQSVKTAVKSQPAKPLSLDPASFDYLQRARSASERGKMLDAVDNFRHVLSRQGGYFPPANLEMSYALLSLKRYDEAIANLLEVSNRDGARYPVSYFHLARVYEIKGELKLAESAFQKAVDAYGSSNSQFLLDIGRVREKQGDLKGALEVLERYVAAMEQQGQRPSWADQRLTELRQKLMPSTAK